MNFLPMHITNQKLSFTIFIVGNLQKNLHGTWSLLNIIMFFCTNKNFIIFTHTTFSWLLLQIYPRNLIYHNILGSHVSYHSVQSPRIVFRHHRVWCDIFLCRATVLMSLFVWTGLSFAL